MGNPQQYPSPVLPTSWVNGFEYETVNDAVLHDSLEFPCNYLEYKSIFVTMLEVVGAGVPGPLWAWIELSPYPTANSTYWQVPQMTTPNRDFWTAIGGGGGPRNPATGLPVTNPLVPHIELGVGVNLTPHSFTLNWTLESGFGRCVIWTPAAAAAAYWMVKVDFKAQKP